MPPNVSAAAAAYRRRHSVTAAEMTRQDGISSLNLSAWCVTLLDLSILSLLSLCLSLCPPSLRMGAHARLDAHAVRSVRFLKMDCEGCEHEVLPSLATSLLPRVAHFEGELHICTGRVSCSFDVGARLATARALCNAGHECYQCFCQGHRPDLTDGAHPLWRERTTDPCAVGVCHKRPNSLACALFVGQRYGQDTTPIYHCDVGPTRNISARAWPVEFASTPLHGQPPTRWLGCPKGVACWDVFGRSFYNLLPRGGLPAEEDRVVQGSPEAHAIFDAFR